MASIRPAVQPIEAGAFTTSGGTLHLLAADRYPVPGTSGPPPVPQGVSNATINDAGQSVFSTASATSQSFWVDTPASRSAASSP